MYINIPHWFNKMYSSRNGDANSLNRNPYQWLIQGGAWWGGAAIPI